MDSTNYRTPSVRTTHFCPAFFRAAYTARTRSGGDCTEVGDRSAPFPPSWRANLLRALGSGLANGSIGRFVPDEARSSDVTVLTILFFVGFGFYHRRGRWGYEYAWRESGDSPGAVAMTPAAVHPSHMRLHQLLLVNIRASVRRRDSAQRAVVPKRKQDPN